MGISEPFSFSPNFKSVRISWQGHVAREALMEMNGMPSSNFCSPLAPNSLDQLFWISSLLFIWNMSHLCSLFIVICPKFEFRESFVKVEKFFCIFPAFELPLDSHFNLRLFGFKAFPLHPYLLSLKVSNFLLKASRCKNPSTRGDAEDVSFRLITPLSLSGRRSWS